FGEPVVRDSCVLEFPELVEVRVPGQAGVRPADGNVVRSVPVEIADGDGRNQIRSGLVDDDLRCAAALGLPAAVVLVVPHVSVRCAANHLRSAIPGQVANGERVTVAARALLPDASREEALAAGVRRAALPPDLA